MRQGMRICDCVAVELTVIINPTRQVCSISFWYEEGWRHVSRRRRLDASSIVILYQDTPSLTKLLWARIASSGNHFTGIFQVYFAKHSTRHLIYVWDWLENVSIGTKPSFSSCSLAASCSMCIRTAATTSTSFTCSHLTSTKGQWDMQTSFSSSTSNLQLAFTLANKSCNFILGFLVTGATGCSRSNWQSLSIAVPLQALTMILLWERKGSPRIIRWHKLCAIRAWTVWAEYQLLQSCSLGLTQWVSETGGVLADLSKKALETGNSLGSKQTGKQSWETNVRSIKLVENHGQSMQRQEHKTRRKGHDYPLHTPIPGGC